MRQVSARDAGYAFLPETTLSSRVLSCWILAAADGGPSGVTAEQMVPVLADRLAVDDMFRSVLRRLPGDIDLPWWVLDPGVDPADHVTVHPPTGLTWDDAQSMLAEIADRPFDMTRPLWSVDVVTDIEGIPGRGGLATVLAVSFHHAAFDGISFERRMHTLLADDPVPHREPIAVGPLDEPWALTVLRAAARTPAIWWRFLPTAAAAAVETRRQADRVRADRALYDRRRAPVTRFNTGVHGGRQTDFLEFDLAEVEAMTALAPGATTNDVLLGIVAGTLLGFLTDVGEEPVGSLICLVPKTTRRRAEESDSGPANQFVPLSVDLHTDVADVAGRMSAIAESSRLEKQRAETVTRSAFWRAVLTAPAPLLRLAGAIARRRPHRPGETTAVNTVLSTVVNETPVATVCSVPVVSGFGVSPLGRETTLAHLAVIGLGRVRLIATADSTVLPDMSAYMRAMQASLDAHRAAVRGAAVASGGRVE